MLPETAPLNGLSDEALARVRAIYEEAFPARQRVPFAELVDGARNGDEIALVGFQEGRPVGIAFLSRLAAAGHLFLEYYAVASDLRGGGRGQALWHAVGAALASSGTPHPVVLEVEDPAEPGTDAAEARARERRIRFWRHAGAVSLPVDGYVIPDVEGAGSEPMRLMWMPARPGDEPPRGARLLDLILALYESGYGLGAEDPLVQRAWEIWG